MEKGGIRRLLYKYLWVICFVIGALGFFYIYYCTPHTSVIDSIWEYLSKILLFMIFSSSFAFFPNQSKKGYLWLIIPLLLYAGFIGSKLDYIGFRVLADGGGGQQGADEYYITLYLLLYPFIVSCLSFAYRIGGGTSGNCIKISFVGVLVLFSSFLNIMFEITNPIEIPDVIPYVYYFKVIVGRFPTFTEEIIFCLCHIPLVIGVLLLPLDKWIDKIFAVERESIVTPVLKETKIPAS